MKIYFYDGQLKNASFPYDLYLVNERMISIIDARFGPKDNIKRLEELQKRKEQYILTNSLVALSHAYGWNWVENHTDIYLWVEKQHKYVRLDELTDREIRCAHNIEKMYLAGVFD